MQIFNTKKYRLEWEKKVEESYNKGKIDGLKEALNSIDNGSNNRKSFKRLTEKELLIEIMNNLILNNVRLTKLGDKVNEISLINSKDLNSENYLENITNTVNNISNLLENEFNQDYTNSLSRMDDNIDNMKLQINEINKKLNKIKDVLDESLSEYNSSSLYAKLRELK